MGRIIFWWVDSRGIEDARIIQSMVCNSLDKCARHACIRVDLVVVINAEEFILQIQSWTASGMAGETSRENAL